MNAAYDLESILRKAVFTLKVCVAASILALPACGYAPAKADANYKAPPSIVSVATPIPTSNQIPYPESNNVYKVFLPFIYSIHPGRSATGVVETATPTQTQTSTYTPAPKPTSTATPLPTPTLTPTPDPLAGCVPDKEIIVDLSEQTIYATLNYCDLYREYLNSSLVSTGTWEHPTVTGTYAIYVKYRYDDMAGPDYYLKDVPFTMYFHEGYGIHGTYWHHNFGTPMSHGCVNLPLDPVEELGGISEAEWFYNWAEIGTEVIVRE